MEPTDGRSDLIGPDRLNIDAAISQCLDNQFVTKEVYDLLARKGLTYEDRKIRERREALFLKEFNRSLLYTSQVVINRAYLVNCEPLTSCYADPDSPNLEACAELVRTEAIVPFLLAERSFTDRMEFGQSEPGLKAARNLWGALGNRARCVRLSTDDQENARRITALESGFGDYLTSLKGIPGGQLDAMARELFGPEVSSGKIEAFGIQLDRLASSAHRIKEETGKVRRNDIYRGWFIRDADHPDKAVQDRAVQLGRFRPESTGAPFLYQLKTLVDLRYNANLPDFLGRNVFTPDSLPNRLALQDIDPNTSLHGKDLVRFFENELPRFLREKILSESRKAMRMPILKNLQLKDHAEIRREIPEWKEFMVAQQEILRNPEDVLNRMEDFQKKFEAFQVSLSHWYTRKYRIPKELNAVYGVVSICLYMAGHHYLKLPDGSYIMPPDGLGGEHIHLGQHYVEMALSRLPERVKSPCVKVVVGFFDAANRALIHDYSHSIQLMQSNMEYTKNEILDLFRRIREVAGDLPVVPWMCADQGRD
jgi:hypothetical protein